MQAVEMKTAVQLAAAPEAPAAEPAQPASKDEASCCAVPSAKTRYGPWLIGGAALAALALYAGWDWLAATGLATVLVAVGPCLLMCVLGLCMGRGKSKGESSLDEIRKTYETRSGEPPSRG